MEYRGNLNNNEFEGNTNNPPFAPIQYSTFQNGPQPKAKNISLDSEVRLYVSSQQRELYESLAEIYSIIVTLDYLEKAYVRDMISQDEYTPVCSRLLAQYSTILKHHDVLEEFHDLDTFKKKYNINSPLATARLKIGVPATVEEGVGSKSSNSSNSKNTSAKAAADAVGSFITFMDAVKLNYRAKDQLHPLLSELMTSLNKVTSADFEGRGKIVQWLITLNAMKATEEISEQQSRQLLFDIENAYNVFYKTLE